MNCTNCNITGKTPRITRGNDFKIIVQLKEHVKSDGETTERDVTIKDGTEPTVNIYNSAGTTISGAYTALVLDGRHAIVISFDNQEGDSGLGNGKYGIEVKGKRTEDNSDFRFYLPPGMGFFIVESTPEGFFPSDSIITYTVDGVVGVAQNVSEGGGGSAEQVQADWNETNTSSKAYIKNKPTIPDEQIQADWNQTTSTAKDFIKNKPTIPSLNGYATQQWVGQQGFLTSHQDISGKEDKMILADNTAISSNTLNANFGKYYNLGTLSAALTIVLPTPSANETKLNGFMVLLTAYQNGLLPVSIPSGYSLIHSGLDELEANKTYEINFVYVGGLKFAATAIEMKSYVQPT